MPISQPFYHYVIISTDRAEDSSGWNGPKRNPRYLKKARWWMTSTLMVVRG
jgi:hypothetical protein